MTFIIDLATVLLPLICVFILLLYSLFSLCTFAQKQVLFILYDVKYQLMIAEQKRDNSAEEAEQTGKNEINCFSAEKVVNNKMKDTNTISSVSNAAADKSFQLLQKFLVGEKINQSREYVRRTDRPSPSM